MICEFFYPCFSLEHVLFQSGAFVSLTSISPKASMWCVWTCQDTRGRVAPGSRTTAFMVRSAASTRSVAACERELKNSVPVWSVLNVHQVSLASAARSSSYVEPVLVLVRWWSNSFPLFKFSSFPKARCLNGCQSVVGCALRNWSCTVKWCLKSKLTLNSICSERFLQLETYKSDICATVWLHHT